ncbi:hypothetical protein [Amycolatopsis sp. GM8]|uniref:hypothetical protein n=1 Tax=Amycolatopsis sp. GM8 TaxID=2896530 RepID=UPI001F4550A4|nr:hypothetical protein [Amycolatopsis sp. GM8]
MTSRAQQLVEEATEAAEVRRHRTRPDVAALQVERVRTQVDRLCWTGIGLGLAFTMANVQHFAAADSAPRSLPWLTAWLLDPTVSLVLLAVLRAEQVTARYRVRTGRWVRCAKWLTIAATYVMNTWSSYAAGSLAGVVLHSVPPLVVFAAAEAITDLRDKLTEAAIMASSEPTVHERRNPKRRKPFEDYLAEARAAWTPGVKITPAWVRQVTSCSRGLSSRLAAELKESVHERD